MRYDGLLDLPPAERKAFLASLPPGELEEVRTDWSLWARPAQREPVGDWFIWLLQTGRGWGKTKTLAEWVRYRVETGARWIGFVGPSASHVRDVMVEGEAGILSVFPPHQQPLYEASKRRVTFHTGARATLYSGDEPRQIRGASLDTAWVDELAYIKSADSWSNLLLATRIGLNPRIATGTTPKPMKVLLDLHKRAKKMGDVWITTGASYDNLANLAEAYKRTVLSAYEGTQLGAQEILGRLLEEYEGALWRRSWIEGNRVDAAPELMRVVVALDPATTAHEASNEAGIIAAGCAKLGREVHYYVLRDTSAVLTPESWARQGIGLYESLQADALVAEANQGGEMIRSVFKAVGRKYADLVKLVNASRGKRTRAEPVAQLYEQARVHHVMQAGPDGKVGFPELEDELCTWLPLETSTSPNRLDALVWAITALQQLADVPTVGGVNIGVGQRWTGGLVVR